MNTRVERFQKSEKLCSRKLITSLINEGNVLYLPLFKVVWQKSPVSLPSAAQVAFSVSKKGFPDAVTRNLLKRRMREAYRRNKPDFYNFLQSENFFIIFLIVYRKNIVADYQTIKQAMNELLDKLSSLIRKNKK